MLLPPSFNPKKISKPHLVTIPYSHYCEVSRWALEHAGIDFIEVQYIPGYHAKVVGQLRRDRADRSKSSYVGQESGVHGGRRKYAVPLLCLPNGRILKDSWEILEHAVGPLDADVQTLLDQELGIAVRQLGYHYLLAPASRHLIKGMISSASLYERILWSFIGDKVVHGMRQLLAITPENAETSRQAVLRIFASMSELLNEQAGTLDASGHFGPIDIAFCSLAAYCVMPENFGNGAVKMPSMTDFTDDFQAFIQQCRDTAVGKYIMASYVRRHVPAA
ncbi:MAG: glutathione S-transferase N-terminal domain-containing protein [Myxococcota bacterium]|nr:glutathione S-transferase N-terminal domain-containing protein [Myxococcota bacterium]